jgi:hypothetical protein
VSSFLALYRGESIGAAKIIAVSASPELVADFAARMLAETVEEESDRVLRELETGRRRALELVKDGVYGE